MTDSLAENEELQRLVSEVRGRGDPTIDALVEHLWSDFRREAGRLLRREQSPRTIQPTELVSQAYLRLRSARGLEWKDRTHVFRVFARAMRRVLTDEARRRASGKHGGDAQRVSLITLGDDTVLPIEEMVALDEALKEMAAGPGNMPRQAEALELVFFAGATWSEVARSQGITERQVHRDWKYARTWLRRRIGA